MASIFGVSHPKFVYNRGQVGEIEVPLPFAVVTRSDPETEQNMTESDIDGTRVVDNRGTHWKVEMVYYLFKEADARTKYQVLQSYKGVQVSFFLHEDGYPFVAASDESSDAMFTLTAVKPYYFTTADYADALKLTFESLVPVWVNHP